MSMILKYKVHTTFLCFLCLLFRANGFVYRWFMRKDVCAICVNDASFNGSISEFSIHCIFIVGICK